MENGGNFIDFIEGVVQTTDVLDCKEYYMILLQYPFSIMYNTRSIVHDEGGFVMRKKKCWIGFFLLVLLFTLSDGAVCFATQTTADKFTYTEKDGVVTITKYIGSATNVDLGAEFPDATEIVIGYMAFDGTGIINITIPKEVSSVGEYAFTNCQSLQVVTFEERTTEPLVFAPSTFKGCTNLLKLNIPDVVAAIPSSFVQDCSALTSVKLPSNCQSIGENAFLECAALKNITIPATCNTIGNKAFQDCGALTTVVFEEREDSTTEFVLGEHAFDSCTSLNSIVLPDNCKSVSEYAFFGCDSLTSVTLPDACESIVGDAFYGCGSLNQMNSDEAGKVVLPAGCKTVGETAFYKCTSISKLYIPEACTSIGEGAFSSCSGLKVITIDNPDAAIGTNALPTANTSNITIYCNGNSNVFNYYNGDTNITIINTSSLTLAISQLPIKTEYYYGERATLDVSGMKLVAERTENESTTQEEIAISDCLVSGFDSEQVGEQTITVSYGGKTVTFTVNVYYNLANAIVEIDNMTYTGVKVEPYMTVTGEETGIALAVNKDYVVFYSNNINAGTATATISGIGLYKGDKTVEFKVLPKAITEANTTVVVADMDYTGSQLRPVPEVACGTEPLILDEDYVVTYGTNINVGKGFVIIEGIGNYDGTIKKWFDIKSVANEENGNSGDNTDSDAGGNTETGDNTGENDNNGGDTIINNNNTTNNNTTNNNTVINNNISGETEKKPVKGKTYTVKGMKYKVTSSTAVTFMKPVSKNIKKCTIPSTVKILGRLFKVTKINKKACYQCKKLTTVSIGNNVTIIGEQSFAKCMKLKKVTIGKGCTTIGKKAFYKDKKLNRLLIRSKKLKSVEKYAVKGTSLPENKGGEIKAPEKKTEEYKKLFKESNK